uniref:Uncharacterized protein n=1 Tax=Candidatus Kentrum sp. LFY TaxID=2126342 RepID=A0A450UBI9_9GAMM|nr:MAG: hypothetical protein BECKLFY1418B_GA0070995_101626 [Candidatus Kentron sp. LFY]
MKHLYFFLICFSLISCSLIPPAERLLEPQEEKLGTDGSTTMLFHSALYYPSEITLTFPGFILGIEKSPIRKITRDGDIKIKAIPESGLSKEELRDEVVDAKILFVSHIIETFGEYHGLKNCARYNAYYRKNQKKPAPPVSFCEIPEPEYEEVPPDEAYISSWKAMKILKEIIEGKIEKHTHVVVVTMGWNTVQEEAIRNFNSIMKNLRQAVLNDDRLKHLKGDKLKQAKEADKLFNPLFIGVTWPSQWAAKWVEPIVRAASFPWKAHDADEVGLTWLGVLLHETLANVSKPIVAIGHSFGARATSVAACIGPAITNTVSETESKLNDKGIDYLINLQGAYRTSRLIGKHREGKPKYANNCNKVKRIILTSSEMDSAMDTLFWRRDKYAGDDESYEKHCGNGSDVIRCAKAEWNGNFETTNNANSHITYINSNDLINKNSYLSGGNAHSDIYRAEHGNLLWNILSSGNH